ncbi:cbb3-type cytochrome c oxidase subunit I [Inquilinus limosus]|uniref:cbb3-type cytochrome c oxidase subunit I n=1 Tax=Inquilinus limosus TaxID=171674 RepID=UPI003F17DD79
MFGKLSWDAIPIDQPISMAASAVSALAITGVLAWVVLAGHWPYLWRGWITSLDHRRIGVMYVLLALVMLARGFADALMMRSQQAVAFRAPGYLPPEHYNQVFSAHGTIMVVFAAMPFVIGLMTYAVPLRLGLRRVAYPALHAVGFWLAVAGATLVNISLVVGGFASTGWVPVPPLSEPKYAPEVGVDYDLWAVQIAGIGLLLAGINLVATILGRRVPGARSRPLPVFCWAALGTGLLILAAVPALLTALALLTLDRTLGFRFFAPDAGGSIAAFTTLVQAWAYPQLYILILPILGVVSEVTAAACGRPLSGRRTMVAAVIAIAAAGLAVWLDRLLALWTGAGAGGVSGMADAVAAAAIGVMLYHWLATILGGRVRLDTPLLWALGAMATLALGVITGLLLAMLPTDAGVRASLAAVAQFHALAGAVLFGAVAGYAAWFPRAFGLPLADDWGRAAFWFTLAGLLLTFVPLAAAGRLGMLPRLQSYDVAAWQPWMIAAAAGTAVALCGGACLVAQLAASILDAAGVPRRDGLRPRAGEVPRTNPAGFLCGVFATALGFGAIWHIWWLAAPGAAGIAATLLALGWRSAPLSRHRDARPAAAAHYRSPRRS